MGASEFSVHSRPALDAMPGLREDWTRLAALSSSGLFHSYDWMSLWFSHFADERPLEVCAVARGGTVQMIAPLYLRPLAMGRLPIRLAETIGTTHLPHNALISDPATLEGSFDALTSFLARNRRVHILRIHALPEESPLTPILRRRESWTIRAHVQENVGCRNRYALIDRGFQAYYQERSSKLRLEVRKDLRQLTLLGPISTRLCSSLDDERAILEAYFDLYARSWQTREGREDFFRDALRFLSARGMLRLFFLELSGRPIAGQLLAVDGETAYNLKNFYDRDFRKYSPGTVLTHDAFHRTTERDHVKTIDYMKGDLEYKGRWAPLARRRLDWTMPITPLGAAALGLKRLAESARAVVRRSDATERRDDHHGDDHHAPERTHADRTGS